MVRTMKVGDVTVNVKVYEGAKAAFEAALANSKRNAAVATALYQVYLRAQSMIEEVDPKHAPHLQGLVDRGNQIPDKYSTIFRECLVVRGSGGKLISRSVDEMKGLQVPREGQVFWSELNVDKSSK